jgi:hypothetical protein
MLPEAVRTRRVALVTLDADGNELSRRTVDVPADYAWRVVDMTTGAVRDVNADDERTDVILRRLFHGRREGERKTHTLEKIGAAGETRYGPKDI